MQPAAVANPKTLLLTLPFVLIFDGAKIFMDMLNKVCNKTTNSLKSSPHQKSVQMEGKSLGLTALKSHPTNTRHFSPSSSQVASSRAPSHVSPAAGVQFELTSNRKMKIVSVQDIGMLVITSLLLIF